MKRVLTLEQCLDLAKNNDKRQVSEYAVQLAQAQRAQALSGYWPQITLNAMANRMDDAPNFIFPSKVIATQMFQFTMPEQDVKLMDRDILMANVEGRYPIYTGGKISSIAKQAEWNVNAARHGARRTDLEVTRDITKTYYADVLAKIILQTAKDTLERMQSTLRLTETFYNGRSLKVKKTDYLRNKMAVAVLGSLAAKAEENKKLAQAALINYMGLPWDTEIESADSELPYSPIQGDLKALVSEAYSFNPDWGRLEAGLKALESGVDEAKSGHLPKLALTGRLSKLE
ncbi:MAG TPA: TolC family protein, partial [Elusimicrobiales bacterium]|nr:TolC family protein [Elusimicrobiales bacterium]